MLDSILLKEIASPGLAMTVMELLYGSRTSGTEIFLHGFLDVLEIVIDDAADFCVLERAIDAKGL